MLNNQSIFSSNFLSVESDKLRPERPYPGVLAVVFKVAKENEHSELGESNESHPEREGHYVSCGFPGPPHSPSFSGSKRGGPGAYVFSNSLQSSRSWPRTTLRETLKRDNGQPGCVPV